MLLTPLPGGRDGLIENLEEIKRALANAQSSQTRVEGTHKAYLDAVAQGARLLRGRVRSADIDELLHTRRYWALLDMTREVNSPSAVIRDLLSLEIADRLLGLDETIATTREALFRWSSNAGRLVLPDTSFYLRNPSVLENVDFPATLGTEDTVTVLIPLVVIEELDRAKRAKDDIRHKAQVALAVLERHARDGLSGRWREAPASASQPGRGEIWFDVLLDPPGHSPLPVADAEIVDRALAVQTLAGRSVTLLTCDTSQAFRARGAGISDVQKLSF